MLLGIVTAVVASPPTAPTPNVHSGRQSVSGARYSHSRQRESAPNHAGSVVAGRRSKVPSSVTTAPGATWKPVVRATTIAIAIDNTARHSRVSDGGYVNERQRHAGYSRHICYSR